MRLAIAAAFLACACATPYQPMGTLGGYEEQQMAQGRWLVHVTGNGYTSQGTVYAYFQRRAGELCEGHPFEVVNGQENNRQGPTYTHTDRFGNTTSITTERPEITGVIQCEREDAPTAAAPEWTPAPAQPTAPITSAVTRSMGSVLDPANPEAEYDAPIQPHGADEDWTVVHVPTADEVNLLGFREAFCRDENIKNEDKGRRYLLTGKDKDVLRILFEDCNDGDHPLHFTSAEADRMRSLGFKRAACSGPHGEQAVDL